MTEEQREQCNVLIRELQDADINVSLHEFRTTSGYRVVGTDGQRRRFLRDGEDPLELLAKMKRRFGVKDMPEVQDIPDAPEVPDVPQVQDVPDDVQDVPQVQDVPDVPEVQDAPEEPQQPPQ